MGKKINVIRPPVIAPDVIPFSDSISTLKVSLYRTDPSRPQIAPVSSEAIIANFIYLQIVELWHGVSEGRANGIDHQRLVMPDF